MFNEILVPVDRSWVAEQILPHVRAMAKAHNSRITLISVLDSADGDHSDHPTDPFQWQIQRAEVEAYLQNLSSKLESGGFSVNTILSYGKAADQVVNQAKMGSTLIMLSSHGQGGPSSWNSGSVTMKVVQQAPTSIMIIRSFPTSDFSQETIQYRRILVPVDGSHRAEYGLFAAEHLARTQGAKIVLAHVIKPLEFARRTPLSPQEQDLGEQVVESNRVGATDYLNALKDSLDCEVDCRIVVSASVTESLHNIVEQEEIDLVILTAHGLGGNPRWPYGNITVNFLAYNTVPLLIVQDFSLEQLREYEESLKNKTGETEERIILNGSMPEYESADGSRRSGGQEYSSQ